MAFDVAGHYDRFMGRFSAPLAHLTVERLAPAPGTRVLDVGCGPGALTSELVARLGAGAVAAVDPSPGFVAAAATRLPGVDVRQAGAQALPFADGEFDLVLAQLVVAFVPDPVAGLREMARVGGRVAASFWDFGGQRSPLELFWRAVRDLDPSHPGEAGWAGGTRGDLARMFRAAGLAPVVDDELTVSAAYSGFEEWWRTYELGIGPVGDFVAALDAEQREALRHRCAELVPADGFEVEATAWFVVSS
ncbi:class I SAM-dependent methyltransferase [Kineococcus rhizosphaerae]|uniref:Methyltransferase family protein n=1 Tax=Kineococcus rhizosphaerae TaxID=559628 RepID=A0A2T0RAF4_9ACTN|nr:methyltransferase domain-containing protein [Kineococcus rhizosphaerae]PRY18139.1 methyltransferase family protein [Kineococcus rhizosphaerae]